MYNYIIIDYSCQGLSLQQNGLLDRVLAGVCITIIMITQQQDNTSELSTGQEVETIYISDQELDALAQELTKEYGDFIGNNIMGID